MESRRPVAPMVGLASLEFPPCPEVQRQHRITLTLEEREAIVRQAIDLLTQMEELDDSPAQSGRRLQLRETLHRLATPLWLDGPEED
jgi:hypothetical protein